nr:DNA-binding pseudobarrel domain-containing protein [Tanacetum cinerariifolium]
MSGINNYALFSHEWQEFLRDSKYVMVSFLHFIRQVQDEYYVTAYQNAGGECNGYDLARAGVVYKIVMQILSFEFLPNLQNNQVAVMVSGIRVSTVTQRTLVLPINRQGHMFSGQGWNILVAVENLQIGTKIVVINLLNNTILLVLFDDSDIALHLENVPTMPLNKDLLFVRSPHKKDKRMEHRCDWVNHEQHENKERCFYSLILAYVTDRKRRTIPWWFVMENNMYTYHNAVLCFDETLFYVDVDLEPHTNQAGDNNHMNIKTNCRDIVDECGLE